MLIAFDDDDNDKPQAKETKKQVLQDALDQSLQEPGSVQGALRTYLLSLYMKTANVKAITQPDDVKSVGDTDTQTSVVTTASSEHSVTDVSSSDLVPGKSTADTVSVSQDKPTVMIVSDSQESVDVQCSSLTWTNSHHVSRQTYHRQAATQGDDALAQRSDVSMASTTAMRATEDPSRIQTTVEPYTGNTVITPSIYVASRSVVISPGNEFDSETHTSMPLTDQPLNCSATMIEYRGPVNPPQDQIIAAMQISCTLRRDIALNNTELDSLIMRHLSVFVV